MLTSERDQLIKVIQEAKQLIDNSNKWLNVKRGVLEFSEKKLCVYIYFCVYEN
jgi:hypothetical protein